MVMIHLTKRKSPLDINITKMAATRKSSLYALLCCSVVWLLSCNPCRDTVRSKVSSADGKLVANVFERNCGATTDFSLMLNVQNSSAKFRPDDGLVFVAKGRYNLSVAWTRRRSIVVTCSNCPRSNIYREVVALGDVDIQYNLGPGQ
jgi:hypothetical protein